MWYIYSAYSNHVASWYNHQILFLQDLLDPEHTKSHML